MRKTVLAFDLDGTLAPSKSEILPAMAGTLAEILKEYRVVVVSGGPYHQFTEQLLSKITCDEALKANLYLFPENGAEFFHWKDGAFASEYKELLSPAQKETIFAAMKEMMAHFGVAPAGNYGEIVEDRGGQVTFSALGQQAPYEEKKKWDPDQAKRKEMQAFLLPKLSDFEVRIGGSTSIDITKKGMNKVYALEKLMSYLKIPKEDIVFFGDAMFPGGNDASVKDAGFRSIAVTDPQDTLVHLRDILEGKVVYE